MRNFESHSALFNELIKTRNAPRPNQFGKLAIARTRYAKHFPLESIRSRSPLLANVAKLHAHRTDVCLSSTMR
ncbi:hypothetical protein Tcan_03632 [Toxocara canis]|uniref:Uncharacterized protein n=1 Tax=Toxocara canis TaxID=6265 RepID=A0A0B2VBX3_TOXCA|nr:hypothetical protein Tcan_03632 [Toxocara canis]